MLVRVWLEVLVFRVWVLLMVRMVMFSGWKVEVVRWFMEGVLGMGDVLV